jgi:hypothetical protein
MCICKTFVHSLYKDNRPRHFLQDLGRRRLRCKKGTSSYSAGLLFARSDGPLGVRKRGWISRVCVSSMVFPSFPLPPLLPILPIFFLLFLLVFFFSPFPSRSERRTNTNLNGPLSSSFFFFSGSTTMAPAPFVFSPFTFIFTSLSSSSLAKIVLNTSTSISGRTYVRVSLRVSYSFGRRPRSACRGARAYASSPRHHQGCCCQIHIGALVQWTVGCLGCVVGAMLDEDQYLARFAIPSFLE